MVRFSIADHIIEWQGEGVKELVAFLNEDSGKKKVKPKKKPTKTQAKKTAGEGLATWLL